MRPLYRFGPPANRGTQPSSRSLIQWHARHQRQRGFKLHIPMRQQCDAEQPVLFAPCYSLGHEEVGHFQAIPDPAVGRLCLNAVNPAHPPGWQHRGFRAHALGVVAVGFVEVRTFSERAFDFLDRQRLANHPGGERQHRTFIDTGQLRQGGAGARMFCSVGCLKSK